MSAEEGVSPDAPVEVESEDEAPSESSHRISPSPPIATARKGATAAQPQLIGHYERAEAEALRETEALREALELESPEPCCTFIIYQGKPFLKKRDVKETSDLPQYSSRSQKVIGIVLNICRQLLRLCM